MASEGVVAYCPEICPTRTDNQPEVQPGSSQLVLPLSHWRTVSMQSTPTGVVMTHAKLLLANTGLAARNTSVLAIHAEKTY